MRRNGVRGALARLAASAAILLGLLAPAAAGDAATFAPIGFSEDGRFFAFEEFGVQDGSGFAYANIYLLDVVADKWVDGAPWRVLLDDEIETLADARAQALAAAQGALNAREVTTPATITALNGDGEILKDDGATLTFGSPGYGLSEPQKRVTLRLTTTFPPPADPNCTEYFIDPPVGFRLEAQREGEGTTLIHDDTSVPRSRGCVEAYRLYGVVGAKDWAWHGHTPVAIISVYPHGFEGPDRRFIAQPLTGLAW